VLILLCEEQCYRNPFYRQDVEEIASRLRAELVHDIDWRDKNLPPYILNYSSSGLALQMTGKKAPGPIHANFVSGGVDHRRKFGGGKGQMIAKAVGLNNIGNPQRPLHVLDATAGLGRDGFVLATLGCKVTLLERSAIVAELLNNGLTLAATAEDLTLQDVVTRMTLIPEDSRDYLRKLALPEAVDKPDVVYLDPMFPARNKSASVKKEMAVFHSVVGADLDSSELLPLALSAAEYRVAVKRPAGAPYLADKKPTYQLLGKTSRYDIYVNKKLDI
jgi:16S rRNA (guanine1516-N2)-methyltransferase